MTIPSPTCPEPLASRTGKTGSVEVPHGIMAQIDRLRFEQGWIEAEFLGCHRTDTFAGTKRSLKLALAFQLAWSLIDAEVAPGSLSLLWPIRYGLVCPLILGFFWLSGTPGFDRLRNRALAVISLVEQGSALFFLLAVGPVSHSFYFPGLILAAFTCATGPGHRFRSSTTINLTMLVGFELAVQLDGRVETLEVLTDSVWLVGTNLAGMIASYTIERQFRCDFWQRRITRDQSEELQRAIRKVEESRREVERISRIDPLTGLFNRRHFFGEARRGEGRVAVVILDVDHFKTINDRFGHSTGDRILKEVAERIKASVRPSDVACRYGGEEFAILLPDSDVKSAAMIAERLRQTIEATPFDVENRPQDVTVSIGVAGVDDRRGGIEELIDRADKALYEAKNAGRNRVKLWQREQKSSLRRNQVGK